MFKFIKNLFKPFKFKMNLGTSSEPRPFPTKASDLPDTPIETIEDLKSIFNPETVKIKEYVWYSPEWDEIRVATKEAGYLFKDKIGEFHLCYHLHKESSFETKEFYLIGEF